MEPTHNHGFGPALAIVVIVAVVALAGIHFYKNMVKDMVYGDPGSTVVVTDVATSSDETNDNLSTSTDIEDISADLEASLEGDLDLSVIDDIDAELLNFDDLDDIDFEI